MRPPLLPHHVSHLKASAISQEVIRARGYSTVDRDGPNRRDSEDRLKRLRIPGWARREPARYPGLLIPLYRATGERISWQYRPDNPPKDPKTGRVRRYASPVGRACVLDVHPHNRDRVVDPAVPLWITEGVKKGDALTSAGACVVTLSGVFNWRSRHGTLGDWEDVALKGRRVFVCFDADAATNASVARAMARLGRWLRSKGAKAVTYVVVPDKVNGKVVKGADDFLAAGGTLAELSAAGTAAPPDPDSPDGSLTDAVLAERVADEALADRFRWTSGLGWLDWDGRRWRHCDEAAVVEAVRQYLRSWYQREVGANCGADRARQLATLLSRGRIGAVTALARGILREDAADFDQQPDLLNTPSGVVDLTTGTLLPHDPDYLLTKMTAAAYDPDAEHEDWDKALEAVPAEVRDWLQLRAGQACTGHMPPDDVLVVCQGSGENGKTTVTGAIGKALGDYHVLVSDRVLLADPTAHPTELMDLRGARFAVVEETPEARRLSVARLKRVVGTPQITARRIRQDGVTFDATHSLFVSTNYRPVVEETDYGTWRRLLLVRYPYRFVKPGTPLSGSLDRQGDPSLRERLLREEKAQQAVLRWLVDGARRWYECGQVMPQPPGTVLDDSRAWRCESDLVLSYVGERLVFEADSYIVGTELLDDFNAHLVARGHRPWSAMTFAARFGDHDTVASYRVEKTRIRLSETRLRRSHRREGLVNVAVSAQPTAWVGVRFRGEGAEPHPGDVG